MRAARKTSARETSARNTPARDGIGSSFFADWTAENVERPSLAQRIREKRPPKRWALPAAGAALVGIVTASVLVPGGAASADPSTHTWYRLRMCESSNNYKTNTGNDHYGAYQFDLATWRSVGGHGYPNQASKAEQDARALILYRKRGWQPWQCASILGLSEDADAGSGHTGDIHIGGGSSGSHHGASHAPAPTAPGKIPTFPGGSHWYVRGDTSAHIKTFQDQMHKRGYFPVGTGEYGPNTERMIKQLQRLNGLVPNGFLGPNTWRLAWQGRYGNPGSGVSAVPTFPGGSHWYHRGETSRNIKVMQDQMHKRGYFPVGTGEYGPNTEHMVKQLQRLNGLVPNGLIGPNTWRLAWVGVYHS